MKRIELRISSIKLGSIKDSVSEEDMKLINDLMRRVIELENLYRIISNQPKVDELQQEIKKIYEILARKLEDKDLKPIKDKNNELELRVKRLEDAFSKDFPEIKIKIENLFNLLHSLQNMKPASSGDNINLSKYVEVIVFNEFRSNINKDIASIQNEIANIKKMIEDILRLLQGKVNKDDLSNLEAFLLSKLEELKIASIKRFADKNDTANNFRIIDEKIKLLMEMKGNVNADNWLLAKKPIGANFCASCEAYIGDLKENNEYIPWNKWPNKDDKLYRKGNGFSKMLQMVNIEPPGDDSKQNFSNNKMRVLTARGQKPANRRDDDLPKLSNF